MKHIKHYSPERESTLVLLVEATCHYTIACLGLGLIFAAIIALATAL